jgi:xylulokinase
MPADGVVIGFDLGTSTAKGAAFDLSGRLLAQAAIGYASHRPHPGWAEQNPDEWWHAFLGVVTKLGQSVPLSSVAAIGVCSQVNSHVAVDSRGRHVGPAITWQDQRCAEVARELDSSISDDNRHRIWGRPAKVDASSLIARSAWLRRNRADQWNQVRWLLSPKDYINLRLTGIAATDAMSPVDMVGDDGEYLPGVIDVLGEAADRLPPILTFTDVLGKVSARESGLSATCVVAVATMDAWGNLYGSGATNVGDAMEVAGTSEILGLLSERAIPTAGIVTFIPVDGLRLHAGPTQAGGDALRWAAETFGLTIQESLSAAAAAEPGARGLVFLPYLSGERAPIWDSTAQGMLFGLTADHARSDVLRAVMEGVAFSARHLLSEIEKAAGREAGILRSSGGGSRSDLWCQIKANVLARPIARLAIADSGALGASLMAAVAAGLLPDLSSAARAMVSIERLFEPESHLQKDYDELYRIYRRLYPALRGEAAALARARARP